MDWASSGTTLNGLEKYMAKSRLQNRVLEYAIWTFCSHWKGRVLRLVGPIYIKEMNSEKDRRLIL